MSFRMPAHVRVVLPLLLAIVLALTLLPSAPAAAGSVYPGTQYREEFFDMGDTLQTRLHADLLRDEDVPWTAQQPVIMVVSPYTNHTTSADSPLYGDPAGGGGMHERFFDFVDATDAIEQGYTLATGAWFPWFPLVVAVVFPLLYGGHARREERVLANAFPMPYEDYRREVPGFGWRLVRARIAEQGETGAPSWKRALRVEALTLNAEFWLLVALWIRSRWLGGG